MLKEQPIKKSITATIRKNTKSFLYKINNLPKCTKLSNLTLTIKLSIDGILFLREIKTMETLVEQRKDSRNTVSWPVSVWVPEANRFFNGRSCNISKTGVFITLPVTAPVRLGHIVELNFPRTETLAKEKGQFARIKTGKVVRVDRKNLLESAEIGVGIAFQ